MDHKDEFNARNTKALEYYTKNLLTLLKYLHIWPYHSFSIYRELSITGLTVTFLLINLLVILSEITAIIVDCNMQRFANGIGTLSFHLVGFLKWTFCIKRSKNITRLMNRLEKCHLLSASIDNQETVKKKYVEIMEETRTSMNIFLYIWTWCCTYGVIHWCTNPIVVKLLIKSWESDSLNNISVLQENPLPFIGWYPWNITDSKNYYSTYLLQVVGAFGSSFGLIAYDVLHISVLMIISAQLRYLNISLVHRHDDNYSSEGSQNNLEEKLKGCIAQHCEVTKFLYNLENLMSPIVFTQCLETLTVLCLLSFEASAIHVTADTKCMMKLSSMLDYFLALSVELYLFCSFATQIKYLVCVRTNELERQFIYRMSQLEPAEHLKNIGLQVADSAYCCGWENANLNKDILANRDIKDLKSLLNMIIARGQKPLILTGGPFYELSLETFKAIIGMAMSNSLILRQIADPD